MNRCQLLLDAFYAHPEDPVCRAIAGVLENARTGSLPKFAQWLGMPEGEFWQMIEQCFPGAIEAGWEPEISFSDTVLPGEFHDLVEMLQADISKQSEQANWASFALASGCFGGGHLWHDMGLTGREDVTAILREYFSPIFEANTDNMKWKKFFYHRICERMDLHPCPEPDCATCDNYAVCYGHEGAETNATPPPNAQINHAIQFKRGEAGLRDQGLNHPAQ